MCDKDCASALYPALCTNNGLAGNGCLPGHLCGFSSLVSRVSSVGNGFPAIISGFPPLVQGINASAKGFDAAAVGFDDGSCRLTLNADRLAVTTRRGPVNAGPE
jgi:hypothetical protein